MRELKKELWPYKIVYGKDVSNTEFREVEMWLGTNVGRFHTKWNVVYHYDRTHIYFKDERDATMFALRWV